MTPPKTVAPMKTGRRPRRPVRARGKASAAKGDDVRELVAPLRCWGRLGSNGQSIVRASTIVTMSVRGISSYWRTRQGYRSDRVNARKVFEIFQHRKLFKVRSLGVSDKLSSGSS